jgi:hypothetical protein
MVFSKRERFVGLVSAGVLALLALDRVAISPLWDRSKAVGDELLVARADISCAEQLVGNAPRMNQRWNEMVKAGLKSEVTDSESQTLRALEKWSREAGLSRVSFQPGRLELVPKQKEFRQLTMRLSGSGSMRDVSHFLWQLQTTTLPIRVTDLQIKSHKDGTDDLALTVAVSTLILPPAQQAKAGGKEGSR